MARQRRRVGLHAGLENLTWHGHNMQEWVELAGVEFDVTG